MSAFLTVKYRIILLVVGTAILLTGVNIYIIRSYQEPLSQYDAMIGNITMANDLLIVTREIVDKDFYSTLSNLSDEPKQAAFIQKVRSLQGNIKILNSHLLTDEESISLRMISRMMDTFVDVCISILDETTPMKTKLANYEKATTIHLLLSENMGDFISLQIHNRHRVAEDLEHTTGQLLVVSILVLFSILCLCVFWGMFYANKIAESIYQEMSYQKKAEKIARHQANHDTLTCLPNRRLFEKFTNNLLQTESDLEMALLFVDLDEFKSVNDKHGHDIGDELLVHFADIFRKCVRVEDMVCRFGGDEFIIVITQSNREMVEDIVKRIIAEIRIPFVVNSLSLSITVSIGISVYPDSGKKIDDLIVMADRAMYLAKEGGKNNFAFASDASVDFPSGACNKDPMSLAQIGTKLS